MPCGDFAPPTVSHVSGATVPLRGSSSTLVSCGENDPILFATHGHLSDAEKLSPDLASGGLTTSQQGLPPVPRLRRTLTAAQLVVFTIFSTAGGPFGLDPAIRAGGPLLSLIVFLGLPILWCLPIALTTAELATAHRENGGVVVYVLRAFGPFWAVQAGLWLFIAAVFNQLSFILIALDATGQLFPFPMFARLLAAAAIIVAIAVISSRGVDAVGRLGPFLLLLVLAPFVYVCAYGIPSAHWSKLLETSSDARGLGGTAAAFGAVLTNGLWNYQGFAAAGQAAGQVRSPKTTFPKAMIAACFAVAAIYVVPLSVTAANSPGPWSDWESGYIIKVAEHIAGHGVALAGIVAIAIGQMGILLSSATAAVLSLEGLATNGLLPLSLFPFTTDRVAAQRRGAALLALLTVVTGAAFSHHERAFEAVTASAALLGAAATGAQLWSAVALRQGKEELAAADAAAAAAAAEAAAEAAVAAVEAAAIATAAAEAAAAYADVGIVAVRVPPLLETADDATAATTAAADAEAGAYAISVDTTATHHAPLGGVETVAEVETGTGADAGVSTEIGAGELAGDAVVLLKTLPPLYPSKSRALAHSNSNSFVGGGGGGSGGGGGGGGVGDNESDYSSLVPPYFPAPPSLTLPASSTAPGSDTLAAAAAAAVSDGGASTAATGPGGASDELRKHYHARLHRQQQQQWQIQQQQWLRDHKASLNGRRNAAANAGNAGSSGGGDGGIGRGSGAGSVGGAGAESHNGLAGAGLAVIDDDDDHTDDHHDHHRCDDCVDRQSDEVGTVAGTCPGPTTAGVVGLDGDDDDVDGNGGGGNGGDCDSDTPHSYATDPLGTAPAAAAAAAAAAGGDGALALALGLGLGDGGDGAAGSDGCGVSEAGSERSLASAPGELTSGLRGSPAPSTHDESGSVAALPLLSSAAAGTTGAGTGAGTGGLLSSFSEADTSILARGSTPPLGSPEDDDGHGHGHRHRRGDDGYGSGGGGDDDDDGGDDEEGYAPLRPGSPHAIATRPVAHGHSRAHGHVAHSHAAYSRAAHSQPRPSAPYGVGLGYGSIGTTTTATNTSSNAVAVSAGAAAGAAGTAVGAAAGSKMSHRPALYGTPSLGALDSAFDAAAPTALPVPTAAAVGAGLDGYPYGSDTETHAALSAAAEAEAAARAAAEAAEAAEWAAEQGEDGAYRVPGGRWVLVLLAIVPTVFVVLLFGTAPLAASIGAGACIASGILGGGIWLCCARYNKEAGALAGAGEYDELPSTFSFGEEGGSSSRGSCINGESVYDGLADGSLHRSRNRSRSHSTSRVRGGSSSDDDSGDDTLSLDPAYMYDSSLPVAAATNAAARCARMASAAKGSIVTGSSGSGSNDPSAAFTTAAAPVGGAVGMGGGGNSYGEPIAVSTSADNLGALTLASGAGTGAGAGVRAGAGAAHGHGHGQEQGHSTLFHVGAGTAFGARGRTASEHRVPSSAAAAVVAAAAAAAAAAMTAGERKGAPLAECEHGFGSSGGSFDDVGEVNKRLVTRAHRANANTNAHGQRMGQGRTGRSADADEAKFSSV